MPKKYFLILFTIISLNSYSQDKKLLDSLNLEINKSPNDFNLQRQIISEYVGSANIDKLRTEIEIAKKRFKNKKDYFNYFRINDIFILLINQENDNASKQLDIYEKNVNFSNLPNTKIIFYYFKGVISNRTGKNKLSENYFNECFKTIKSNNIEKKQYRNIYINYGNSLLRNGEYEKSLNTFFELLKIIPQNEKYNVYTNIGICYYNLKQLDKSEQYYKLGVENADIQNKPNCSANLAILYMEINNYLKAEQTIKKLDFTKFSASDSSAVFNVLGEIEQHKKNYTQAILNYNIVVSLDKKQDRYSDLANDYAAIGAMYMEMKDYKSANSYLFKSMDLLKEYDDKNAEKQVLEGLIESEFAITNNQEYKKYFTRYLSITDSINSEIVQTNSNLLETKFRTAEKEFKIKTQQLQIQKEKANKNIALTGIAFILLLGFGGFWLYRNKQNQTNLKTQNTLLGLQQNLVEAELSNLNKQLDPHEIKNILASISPEIQEKAPESYKKMLKLFNLTKASLNSNSITDSIENQLQQIDDFLSLEKSMLPIPLNYSIENKIQNTQTQIPRLLLKNLVENALKHGIKQQEIGGNISVQIEEKDSFIYISVDDTGKGRNLAISLDSGIGTTTYQKLFATLNPKNKENATFEIIDKQQGTKVEVKIPTNYKYS